MKQRFKDGVEEASKHLLGHTVSNRRNAQWTQLAIAFVNKLASQGFGFEGTVLEGGHYGLKVGGEVRLKHFDANLIDPGCAPVAFDGLEALRDNLTSGSDLDLTPSP